MIQVRQTGAFAKWVSALCDSRARAKILARIDRLTLGNFGDVEPVGSGVSELRVHYGPELPAYILFGAATR
jgi:putative addiction module killer protein